MNKRLLRNIILTLVGTTFTVSAFAYPIWHAERPLIRPLASASAEGASQVVADAVTEESEGIDITADELDVLMEAERSEKVAAYDMPMVGDTWKTADPVAVIKSQAAKFGFDAAHDKFVLLSKHANQAKVLVVHDDKEYIVTLDYPSGSWWKTGSAWELIHHETTSGEIITGNIKIDTNKMKDLQKIVNVGYQTWRLNPLKVAKYQASAFGFNTSTDTFTLLKQVAKGSDSGTGEADVQVKHGNETYIIHLVQPLGAGEDMIWAVKSVKKTAANGNTDTPAPISETLYSNSLLDKWTWSKGALPQHMAFTAVVDYDAQRKQDNRFRNDIWDIISSYDHNKNVMLLAYMGTMPTGGYDIGIRKVSVKGQEVTVEVNFKSPASGSAVTQAETYPFDVVLVPKHKLALDKKVTFKFVDEDGKLLTTVETTVK